MWPKVRVSLWYIFSYLIINGIMTDVLFHIGLDIMSASAIGLAGGLFAIIQYHRRYDDKIFNKEHITWRNFLFAVCIGIVGQIVTTMLVSFLSEVIVSNQKDVEKLISMSSIAGKFFAIVIFGPIVEELLFRHLIINILLKHQQWIGILLSAILFALAHRANSLTEYVIYGMPGLVLGYINVKLGVENAIFWHMLMNGLAFSVLLGAG